jgi:outer membrane protein assembly factor BamB
LSSPAASEDGRIYVQNGWGTLFAVGREEGVLNRFDYESFLMFGLAVLEGDDEHFIFIGTADGRLLKLSSGFEIEWVFSDEYDIGRITGGPSIGANGRVYFGTEKGVVYCLDSESGSKLWRFETGWEITAKPAECEDGVLYFGTRPSSPEPQKALFYAIRDGEELWTFQPKGESMGFHSSPSIHSSSGTIYTGCHDGNLYALNKNGELLWSVDISSETERGISSSPVIGPDGTIYIGNRAGSLFAISQSGGIIWKKGIGERIDGTPVISNSGQVYVVSYYRTKYGDFEPTLHILNSDGEIEKQISLGSQAMGSPLMTNDGVLVLCSDVRFRRNGVIYLFDTGSSPAGPWPMFGRDAQRTSRAD